MYVRFHGLHRLKSTESWVEAIFAETTVVYSGAVGVADLCVVKCTCGRLFLSPE